MQPQCRFGIDMKLGATNGGGSVPVRRHWYFRLSDGNRHEHSPSVNRSLVMRAAFAPSRIVPSTMVQALSRSRRPK
jgi:hypothetical protein